MPGSALGPKLSVDDLDLSGKNVLVRVDFNVPIKNGKILDDFRITSALPTLKKIISSNGKLIIVSHLGRPKETGYEAEYSLKPIAEHLSTLLGKPVAFAPDCMDMDLSLQTPCTADTRTEGPTGARCVVYTNDSALPRECPSKSQLLLCVRARCMHEHRHRGR